MIIQFKSPNALVPLIFTVDSGAQISIIKPNNLYKDEIVNNKEKISITGVAKGSKLVTLGTINVNLIVNNFSLFHKFHILNNGFNLKTDGILGMDFLLKFNSKIDLLNKSIKMQLKVNSKNEINTNGNSIIPTESFISVFQINRDINIKEKEYNDYVTEFENKFREVEKEMSNDKEFYESFITCQLFQTTKIQRNNNEKNKY